MTCENLNHELKCDIAFHFFLALLTHQFFMGTPTDLSLLILLLHTFDKNV